MRLTSNLTSKNSAKRRRKTFSALDGTLVSSKTSWIPETQTNDAIRHRLVEFLVSTPYIFSAFFFPWKSKSIPWKFWTIFGFSNVKIFFLSWKNLENFPWKVNCVSENFFQITYVKMETSVREKYNLIFPWNLMNFTLSCTREKKKPYMKIIDNFSFFFCFLPVKKKKTSREKILTCVRENFWPPVKNSK